MAEAVDDETILVTGASGFIASHLVHLLLTRGYKVRGTVRSLKNQAKVKPLREICPEAKHPLELVEADLNEPNSWIKAVDGCTYVYHVASPFPPEAPRHEDEVIRPAVDGTLSVLKACSVHRVKRVVLTSSAAAVFGDIADKEIPGKVYTEADWTDVETVGDAYTKSKTLAERAAWNYVQQLSENDRFELAVINPVFVLGPILCLGDATSAVILMKLMNREMPLVPRLNFNVVDVRDVALAHLKAMTVPEAAGNRFIVYSGHNMWFQDVAIILDKEFKSQGYSIPTSLCPYPLLWVTSLFDKTAKYALPMLNKEKHLNNKEMRTVLEITPTDVTKTILDMAYSLIEKGYVKKTRKYRGQPTTTVNF